jgi:hypothetical protein
MPSSGRYQSWLFNFLDRQARQWQDRAAVGLRYLQLTVTWGAQILLYPIYAAFQANRLLAQQGRSPAQTLYLEPGQDPVGSQGAEVTNSQQGDDRQRLVGDHRLETVLLKKLGSRLRDVSTQPWFQQLMAWMQTNDFARTTNFFQEATAELPPEPVPFPTPKLLPASVTTVIKLRAGQDTEKTLRFLDLSLALVEQVTAHTPLPKQMQALQNTLDQRVFGEWIPPLPGWMPPVVDLELYATTEIPVPIQASDETATTQTIESPTPAPLFSPDLEAIDPFPAALPEPDSPVQSFQALEAMGALKASGATFTATAQEGDSSRFAPTFVEDYPPDITPSRFPEQSLEQRSLEQLFDHLMIDHRMTTPDDSPNPQVPDPDLPPASSLPVPQSTFEDLTWIDIDVETVPVGYEKHPLEAALHLLDRLMVWVEGSLVRILKRLWRSVRRRPR